MKHNKLYILVAVIVLSSMILAACATPPTPTVVVTEAPADPSAGSDHTTRSTAH